MSDEKRGYLLMADLGNDAVEYGVYPTLEGARARWQWLKENDQRLAVRRTVYLCELLDEMRVGRD
jgi:hypothetical protein